MSEISSALRIPGLNLSDSISAINILAEVRLKQFKYSEALQLAMLVTSIDPTNARSYAFQSLAEKGLGNPEMALKLKTKALEIDPRTKLLFNGN